MEPLGPDRRFTPISYTLGTFLVFLGSYIFIDGASVVIRIIAALILGWFLSLPIASLIGKSAGRPQLDADWNEQNDIEDSPPPPPPKKEPED
jgi:hypothetical protein